MCLAALWCRNPRCRRAGNRGSLGVWEQNRRTLRHVEKDFGGALRHPRRPPGGESGGPDRRAVASQRHVGEPGACGGRQNRIHQSEAPSPRLRVHLRQCVDRTRGKGRVHQAARWQGPSPRGRDQLGVPRCGQDRRGGAAGLPAIPLLPRRPLPQPHPLPPHHGGVGAEAPWLRLWLRWKNPPKPLLVQQLVLQQLLQLRPPVACVRPAAPDHLEERCLRQRSFFKLRSLAIAST